ncbi:MAG: histidine phosphatase family protein [Lachnospiraceae bacterium]
MKIYLVRHGRQDSALCNVDVPMSAEGHEQVRLLGERIQSWGIEVIYSSDLIRARETAQELQKYIPVEIQERENLKEINFGELTGKTDEENWEKYKFFFEKKKKMQWDLEYPGGENNEEVFKRGMPVLQEIVESGYDTVLVVTHGGFIRALLCGILQLPFSRAYQIGKIMENSSITELNYNRETKQFSVERLNDYAHLEGHKELLRSGWKRCL